MRKLNKQDLYKLVGGEDKPAKAKPKKEKKITQPPEDLDATK